MVGKLNDMVTAAVVLDWTPKSKPSATQSQNATTQINAAEPAQQQQSTLSALTKTKESAQTSAPTKKAEEDKQAQEAVARRGTIPKESVSEMVEKINKMLKNNNINLEFNYDQEVDLMNVKVIDKETKKVLREFPPEEMIENMKKAREWLGALIDRAI